MEFGDKRWTSYGVLLVDPFPIEKQHKFVQIWIPMQKKNEHRIKKFLKNAISEAETMEFGKKMMNFLQNLACWSISHQKAAQIKQARKWKFSKKLPFPRPKQWNLAENDYPPMDLARWPISNRKATQICVEFRREKKKKQWNSNFRNNAISEAETMEFGEKQYTSCGVLLVDPFSIDRLHKFAWIWILAQKNKY